MSVVIETTLGDITVDLFLKERPRCCLNFLKLCKIKYFNFSLFHTVSRGFIAQTGDPTGSRTGGESIFGVIEGPSKRYFEAETNPRIKHSVSGLISFVGNEEQMIGSQFFFTLSEELTYLDGKHCVFGQVVEGMDVLELINEAICDGDDRPYQDIRITHTVVLDDPLSDLKGLVVPSRSPSPSAERLQGGRIAPDEQIDETAGKSMEEINEIIAEREAKARATILEMVGDLPDADMAPPENVLFVCKLNPVTTDDDLEIIFSRFGKIKSCEVIRDHKTGDSLQYAFVEFEEKKSCEDAYFKMDNVLIDDRRIHVDFSQSVSKVKWMGKGRGVKHFDEQGREKTGRKNIQRNETRKKSNSSERERKEWRSQNKRRRSRSKESSRHQQTKRSRSRTTSKKKYNEKEENKNYNRSSSRKHSSEKYRRKDYSSEDSDYNKKKTEKKSKNVERKNKSKRNESPSSDSEKDRKKTKKHKSRKYSDSSSDEDRKRRAKYKKSKHYGSSSSSETETQTKGRKHKRGSVSTSDSKEKYKKKYRDGSSESDVQKKTLIIRRKLEEIEIKQRIIARKKK